MTQRLLRDVKVFFASQKWIEKEGNALDPSLNSENKNKKTTRPSMWDMVNWGTCVVQKDRYQWNVDSALQMSRVTCHTRWFLVHNIHLSGPPVEPFQIQTRSCGFTKDIHNSSPWPQRCASPASLGHSNSRLETTKVSGLWIFFLWVWPRLAWRRLLFERESRWSYQMVTPLSPSLSTVTQVACRTNYFALRTL